MNPNQNDQIRELKEKIAEIRDYISSDFCKSCFNYYKQIEDLEKRLSELQQK
jgi:hypothetical protein